MTLSFIIRYYHIIISILAVPTNAISYLPSLKAISFKSNYKQHSSSSLYYAPYFFFFSLAFYIFLSYLFRFLWFLLLPLIPTTFTLFFISLFIRLLLPPPTNPLLSVSIVFFSFLFLFLLPCNLSKVV